MSRETVNRICADLPGAERSDPWGGGHDCWKMFAVTGAVNQAVAVKTDSIETAEMLIEVGPARRAAYFHRSWVELPLTAPEDELRHQIRASYRIIRKALPKKLQITLKDF